MATRIAGFVYTLSTGLAASGVTVRPRASDGSIGATGVTNSAGFVSIAGLADKTWFGTVADASRVFIPVTMGESEIVDDLHGQRNTLGAHDFSQLRGKATVGQLSSESATAAYVLTSDGLGNVTWSPPTGGGASALDDLTDVTITAAAANDFLAYNGAAWVDFDLFGTGNTWTAGQSLSAQLTSTLATGTSPFSIASTTVCANLNADLLDGSHASAFATSGHAHALDDLSDVVITTPASDAFLKYSLGSWIDFDLFNTANTWSLLQTLTSGFAVATTVAGQFGSTGLTITGTSASTLLEIKANNLISAGEIRINPRVTLDCEINGTPMLALTSGSLALISGIPMTLGGTSQFVKGTSGGSPMLELSSTAASGIIRYDAKASQDFRIDSATEATLTANKLALNAGTYHVGFGWSVDGQLDTIIDNAYVDGFVGIQTTHATDGSMGSGIKHLYRGIGLDATTQADVGSFHAYYEDGTGSSTFDWTLPVGMGSQDKYRFIIGSATIAALRASTWLTLNDASTTTKFTISEDVNDDVVIATSGSDNPQIVLRPRGNAGMTLQSSSTAAYSATWDSTVNTIQLTASNASNVSFQIDKSTSGQFSFFVGTGAPTNTLIYLGKAHASSGLSFFGVTAAAQQAQTVDLKQQLINYGLMSSSSGATPLNLGGGTLTAAKLVSTELEFAGSITIDPASASNVMVTVENSSSGKATLRVTPNTSAPASDADYAKVGGLLVSTTTSYSSTATTSEEVLFTHTIPANAFTTNGDEIHFGFYVSFAATARTKALRIKMGTGSVSGDILGVSTGAGNGYVRGVIRKTGGGMAGYTHAFPNATGYATSGINVTMSSGDSGASSWTIEIRSQVGAGAAAADVVVTGYGSYWYPGASA